MGKLANTAFYLFTFFTFLCVLVVLFSKKAKFYIYAAIASFIGIAGIYLSLKSTFMFAFEILFFVIILGLLMIYMKKNVILDEKKNLININFQTLVSALILALFAVISAPFFIHQLKLNNPRLLLNSEFVSKFIDTFDLNLFVVSIIALTVLSGFYTIAFWRKK